MADGSRQLNAPPPPRGILRAQKPDGSLDGRRVLPSAALAGHVHHFWSLRWALRSPFTAEALPHPAAQILNVHGRAQLLGVQTGRLSRSLTGEGRMFGIAFRPAMFPPLTFGSMSGLTDHIVPLDSVLGPKANEWSRALGEARDVDEELSITETFLSSVLPAPDPGTERLRDLMERIAFDRSILRVEDAASVSGLDIRALQRCFRTHVGVSPKWVIQRYRLLEASVQLASPCPPTLAELATSLGYADQAHFNRDFKRAIGQTPRAFVRLHLHTPRNRDVREPYRLQQNGGAVLAASSRASGGPR
jgi:AraC-like DNA-binding protein